MKNRVSGTLVATIAIAAVGLLWFLGDTHPFSGTVWRITQWGKESVYWPVEKCFRDLVLAPLSLAAILSIFLLQLFFPAKPHQRALTGAVAQDVVFLFMGAVFSVTITAVYVAFLRNWYDQHLSFLTVSPLSAWPEPARMVFAIFIADFVYWLHHYVRHKVPWFWEFHALHHAQRELNMFTDDRYHFVEYVIENTFNVLILSMLTVSAMNIVAFQVFRKWYTRLYHSNIRSNYGFLRHVLVTPQSHRIHHSIESRHRDQNFGVLFSVWDRMFGTQYDACDEYPDTGIADESFPRETLVPGLGLILMPLAQLVYPFQVIILSVVRRTK